MASDFVSHIELLHLEGICGMWAQRHKENAYHIDCEDCEAGEDRKRKSEKMFYTILDGS